MKTTATTVTTRKGWDASALLRNSPRTGICGQGKEPMKVGSSQSANTDVNRRGSFLEKGQMLISNIRAIVLISSEKGNQHCSSET